MKHSREDYNRIQDPAGLIPETEPVFLLRGQDIIAPTAVRAYADALEREKGDATIIEGARKCADDMEAWQATQKAKMPDVGGYEAGTPFVFKLIPPKGVSPLFKTHERVIFAQTEEEARSLLEQRKWLPNGYTIASVRDGNMVPEVRAKLMRQGKIPMKR